MKNFFTKNLILIIAVVCLVVTVMSVVQYVNDKRDCTATVEAKLVDFKVEESTTTSNGKTKHTYSYYPIFEYTVDGTYYKEKYSQSVNTKKYAVGDTVELKYDPTYPKYFIMKGDNRTLVTACWEGAVGIILLVSDVRARIKKAKKRKAKEAEAGYEE